MHASSASGGHRRALQDEQIFNQNLDLGFRFETEQVEHRQIAQVCDAHARLRLSMENNLSSSSKPTE